MLNLNLKISYRIFFLLNIIILTYSCSHFSGAPSVGNNEELFLFKDRSGEYFYKREVKINNKEIATRISVVNPNNLAASLEKTVSVSAIGIIGKNKIIRPNVSQHTIWYEKEKYFSQLKTNLKTKTLDVVMQSPEEKWNGEKSIEFPSARIFCFFTQVPECVQFYGMLTADQKKSFNLVIIWDNYPYHTESYASVSENAFQAGSFSLDGEIKSSKRYKLEIGNQIIFYEFDVNKQFDKMYWIAQGITLIRKNKVSSEY